MTNSDILSLCWPTEHAVILYVGDKTDTVDQIRRDLAPTGSRVICCRTQRGVRRILKDVPVDVLLLHQQSYTLVQIGSFLKLRHEFPEQTLFALLLTSSTQWEEIAPMFEAGIDDFVTLPYHRLAFLANIRMGVRLATLHRELQEKNENLSVAATSYKGAFKQVGDLAQELQQKNQQLKELSNLKDEMVGIVAHDLRNPVSAVEMYTDYLIEELKDLAEEPKSFLLNTKTLVSEVLTMLSELLDLSSFESGRVEIHPADVGLRQFLEPVIAQMNLLFNQKRINYQLDLNEAPESWVFDKKRIAQVLENILTNAAKFSNPDSPVVVHISKQEDFLRIAVQDKGQGIPEDEIPKVFQKFHKGYAKPTAGESSTGLGLAIAKQIVEQHQGNIEVKSQMGEGSTFTIILPSVVHELNEENETQQAAYVTP